jgi:predicted  nucleic acid-binding Zn-ribbon protein
MSPADLTAYIGTPVSIIGVILIPLWLFRRKRNDDRDMADVVSWESMNKSLKDDVDRLKRELRETREDHQRQLDAMSAQHREQIKQLDADWEARMATAQARATGLEQQLTVLREELARLFRPGGTS